MRLPLITLAMLFGTNVALAADKYAIDPSHTYPHFEIDHLGYSTMHGRFDNNKGSMSYDQDAGTGEVEITIDANSISTGWAKRDEHLRSADFLNTKEFPEITFKSTKASLKGGKGTVDGKLTMMGVTKDVTLNVSRVHCGAHPFNKKMVCGFDASTTIKRSDFGSKYGLPAIGDEMKLMFEVEAVKE